MEVALVRGDKEKKADQIMRRATRLARQDGYDVPRVLALLKEAIALGSGQAQYALATWYLFGNGEHIKKDWTEAVKLLQRAARKNVPAALFDLGVCYERGAGVEKDPKMAFRCYLRGALFGDEQSGAAVYKCYFYGAGVKQDRELAKIWRSRFGRRKRPR